MTMRTNTAYLLTACRPLPWPLGRLFRAFCSNAVNGVPSCANPWLLTTVAREEWSFDGYITSDCGAVRDVYSAHHFAANESQAVAQVLNAGMDIDCGSFLGATPPPPCLTRKSLESHQVERH